MPEIKLDNYIINKVKIFVDYQGESAICVYEINADRWYVLVAPDDIKLRFGSLAARKLETEYIHIPDNCSIEQFSNKELVNMANNPDIMFCQSGTTQDVMIDINEFEKLLGV